MLIGLSEAAKITGKNRTTIFRAMKSGRLSFTVNGNGERQVDVAELERVFPIARAPEPESNMPHAAVLQAQLEAERRINAGLERANEDLRRRLDEAQAERRTVHVQLTALLADRREVPAAAAVPAVSWRRRLRGWWAR